MGKDDAPDVIPLASVQPEFRQDEPVMDQGLHAWLHVLGSWILFANTW